jgi:D-sedoheptulose 7-phosphate isomerase
MNKVIENYLLLHNCVVKQEKFKHEVYIFCKTLLKAYRKNKQIFICGNGGSAANAIHFASDLSTLNYKKKKKSFKATSLNANLSELTCLANDIEYKFIFSEQLKVKAEAGDILIVLSGSGNSKNIIEALKQAKKNNIITIGILGYNGGLAKKKCDVVVNLNINDMEVSEDFQLIIHHMAKKFLLGKI